MSIAAGLAPARTHRAWAAFVVLEVLVVAVTIAMDFYAAGLVLAGVAGMFSALHRYGLAGLRWHHGRTPSGPALP
jgi:hypothetical protein